MTLTGRVRLLAVASVVAVMLAAFGPAAAHADPECTVDALLVNSCRPWLGATSMGYPQVGSGRATQLAYLEQRIGRQVDVAHTYHAVGDNKLSADDVALATRPATMLYTNWKLTKTWSAAAGGDATVNAQIDQMATSIQSLGATPVFLTLSHEPENDVSSDPNCPGLTYKGTAGTPEDYRAMWRNVRARFDALGVTNVVWVMDYMNWPAWDCLVDDVYPGDDLVDWITFNGYQGGNSGVDFVSRVGRFYSLLTDHSTVDHDYVSKPWGIAEWSAYRCTQANAKLYYAQAKAAVENDTFPRLHLYMVFDNVDNNTGDASYRVAYDTTGTFDQSEQDAFTSYARSFALTGDGTDHTPPSVPSSLTVTASPQVSSGRPVLTWGAATDDGSVTGYQVWRDGTLLATTGASTTFTDDTAAAGSSHTYTVRAVDEAGNVSPDSSPATVTVGDTTAPSAPGGLAATVSGGTVTLAWTAATDDVGVTSYDVLRAGSVVGTTATTSYGDTTAPQGARSTWTVRARDAAGNVGPVATVSATVPDVTAPTAPGALSVARAGTAATLSWTPASDNVAVTGYVVYRGTTRLTRVAGTVTSYRATGLGSRTTYSWRVVAVDKAGNTGPAATASG